MSGCDSIFVGSLGPVAWVRIEGSANHEKCGGIRQFLRNQFGEGCRQFVVDLEECRGIDSTFIGILYNLATDVLAKDENGAVQLINTSQRNADSIRKLGLDCVIQIEQGGESWKAEQVLVKENIGKPAECIELTKKEHAEMILDAHQVLLESNEANETRFRDVVEYMRRDLEETEGNN